MAVIYKITNPSDRARVRRLERVRRWIAEVGPDAAELVLDHIARAA